MCLTSASIGSGIQAIAIASAAQMFREDYVGAPLLPVLFPLPSFPSAQAGICYGLKGPRRTRSRSVALMAPKKGKAKAKGQAPVDRRFLLSIPFLFLLPGATCANLPWMAYACA